VTAEPAGTADAPVPPRLSPRRRQLGLAATGAALAALLWITFQQLAAGLLPFIDKDYTLPLAAIAGGFLGTSRFRRLLWAAAGLVLGAYLVLGFTPLADGLVGGPVRVDRLERAPAIVALSAGGNPEGRLTPYGQERALRALELVGEGYAPVLVLTHGYARYPSWARPVRSQMERLRLQAEVVETEPVNDTHDEAVAVAALARQRGWDRVILVTHDFHMDRAAAAFEKAGLPVIAAPCEHLGYNRKRPRSPGGRLQAFRDWAHERLATWKYRRAGWL
jgi:uncharacterized SAM-binding protein YcdF (DUF218 family)